MVLFSVTLVLLTRGQSWRQCETATSAFFTAKTPPSIYKIYEMGKEIRKNFRKQEGQETLVRLHQLSTKFIDRIEFSK